MINTIVKSFDIWVDAQGIKSRGRVKSIDNISLEGIARLRELVLELAIQGKLVPQDATEESAEVLLSTIKRAKSEFIQKNKLKAEPILPEIELEEFEFIVPENWKWVRFNDITTYIQRGKGPKYAEKGSVMVISQKCVQWSGLNLTMGKFIEDDSINSYSFERFLQKNDILWNSTGTGTVGRAAIVDYLPQTRLVVDSHVTVIRPVFVNCNYVKIYISSNRIQQKIHPGSCNSLVSGSTNQVELNRSAVISLPIPLPPLGEQKRIAAKVKELMTLCDELEAQQTNHLKTHQQLVKTLLETLTQAKDADEVDEAWKQLLPHFDTLFCTEDSIAQLEQTILQLAIMGRLVKQDHRDEPASELIKSIEKERKKLNKESKIKNEKSLPIISKSERLFELPQNWEWVRLKDIATVFSGASFSSKDFNETSGVKVIKISNVGVGELIETNDYLPENFLNEFSQYLVKENDLIFALTRPFISAGLKITKCPISYNNSLLNQRVASIRLIDLTEYVYLYLRSPHILSLFQKRFGSSGLQPNLKISDVTSLAIALPSLSEQKRIVAKVYKLMALCDQLKKKTIKSQQLKNILSKTVFESVTP